LRLVVPLTTFVDPGVRLGQCAQSCGSLPFLSLRCRRQGEPIRLSELGSGGLVDRETATHLGEPLRCLSLLGYCPTLQTRSFGQPERKLRLSRKCHRCRCSLLPRRHLTTKVMQLCGKKQRHSQAVGMRKFLRQDQRLLTPLEGLVRIAQVPEGPGHVRKTRH